MAASQLRGSAFAVSLKRHFGGYAVVGIVQWLVEYGIMVALSAWLMPVEPANIIGRICGAMLGLSLIHI